HDVAVVGERLAHAHEHDVGDVGPRVAAAAIAVPGPRLGQFTVREPHLPDDFRDAQIAVETLLRGRAKRTVHGATHLARDAQGPAIRLGYVHRLDPLHLVHAQHPFAGAVARLLLGHDLRNRDLRDRAQLRAE